MKRLFTILIAVFFTVCAFSQAPQKMSYQAVIRNTGNALVSSTTIGMHISILRGSASGLEVYAETQTPETNINGLVTIIIGEGTQVSIDAFEDIDWSLGPYFIKTGTDPTKGGTNYTKIVGTSQLLSVPYALYAESTTALETRLDSLISALSPPVAAFSADLTTIAVDGSVQFTDVSTNIPTSWSWDFGDGSSASIEQNPSHIYTVAGTYTVTFTATNDNGTDDEEKTDYITVNPPPVAAFSADETIITVDGIVDFTDASTNDPTSWSWDFGDGSSASIEQSPSHIYTVAGTYTVTLTATNAYGSDDEEKTDYIIVLAEDEIIDVDGNIYSTVTIDTQVWMAENLKVTHYSNNDAIPLVTGDGTWATLVNGDAEADKAYCWYYDDYATNSSYGALYTYAAATNGDNSGSNVQGACPVGWHLPNSTEWTVLYNFLGGKESNSGSKLAGRADLWTDGALDSDVDFGSSGFNGIPCSGRPDLIGTFAEPGQHAYWWSSTQNAPVNGSKIELIYSETRVSRHNDHPKSGGLTIRCIKD
jgi:uncharacterized protein (TIGR02145 family)